MWPTIDGLRVLRDQEAVLVRRAVCAMTNDLVAAHREHSDGNAYGIDWFDQWDAAQRLWLLEQVAVALLRPDPPPPPAAIWEATIDAIFCHVIESIDEEVDRSVPTDDSWRDAVLEAFRCQHQRLHRIHSEEKDLKQWRMVTTQVADMILGTTSYQKAESFRDGKIENSRRFLMQKGLPEDFLQKIPPLRSPEQTQQTIDRLEAMVCP